MLITDKITRNDQKYLAEALKNSPVENLPYDSYSILNNPPERNILRRKPTTNKRKNPDERYDIRLVRASPKSEKTSKSIPSISLSVIMLLPKPEFKDPLTGSARRLTNNSDKNQIIKIPFHDFSERKTAILTAIKTFIII
jgi:hypothetical protein